MLQDMSGACKQNLHYPLDFLAEKRYTYQVEMTWACSSVGSASVSLLCPTELWAFKWGVCRLVAQPRHAPKYGPIAQLGERSVRIREVKGSNPSRSTFSSSVILTLLLFFCITTRTRQGRSKPFLEREGFGFFVFGGVPRRTTKASAVHCGCLFFMPRPLS